MSRACRIVVVLSAVLLASAFLTQRRQTISHGTLRVETLTEGDGAYLYDWLLSIGVDGDLDLANQYRLFGNNWGFSATATGRPDNPFPVGPAILWLPGFLVGRAAVLTASAFGAGLPTHGHTLLEEATALATSCLAGFVVLLLVFKCSRRFVGEAGAMIGAVLILFGTNLFYYAALAPSFGHALVAAGIGFFVYHWYGAPDAPLRWWLCGLGIGLASLVRLQEVVWLILPATEAAIGVAAALRRRDPRLALTLLFRAASCCAVVAACILPQLYVFQALYGTPLHLPQGQTFMRWQDSAWSEVLFASRNGLFPWTPIAHFGVIGLLAAPSGQRVRSFALLLMLLVESYVNGAAWDWWGGTAFGQRRMLGLAVPLGIGLSFLAQRLVPRRAALRSRPRLARTVHWTLALISAALCALFGSSALRTAYHLDRRTGKIRTGVAQRMCCWQFPGFLRPPLEYVARGIGNPLTFPANLVFAWRHGVHPARYDTLVGSYFLEVTNRQYRSGAFRRATGLLRFDGGRDARYVVAGLRVLPAGGVSQVVADRARILVPLFLKERQRWTLRARMPTGTAVGVHVNGTRIGSSRGDGNWREDRLAVPASTLRVGINRLELVVGGDREAVQVAWLSLGIADSAAPDAAEGPGP